MQNIVFLCGINKSQFKKRENNMQNGVYFVLSNRLISRNKLRLTDYRLPSHENLAYMISINSTNIILHVCPKARSWVRCRTIKYQPPWNSFYNNIFAKCSQEIKKNYINKHIMYTFPLFYVNISFWILLKVVLKLLYLTPYIVKSLQQIKKNWSTTIGGFDLCKLTSIQRKIFS